MNLTVLFIVLLVVVVAIFDVYIIAKKGKQESISAHMIRGSKKYPLLVFLSGICAGHILWSMATADIYYDMTCEKITKEAK